MRERKETEEKKKKGTKKKEKERHKEREGVRMVGEVAGAAGSAKIYVLAI